MHRLTVRHVTVYRYRQPVAFGPHRLMFRPRDSHDLRLVTTALKIEPAATVRWLHDVFGNSIAIANFAERADVLRFESRITVENFGLEDTDFPVEEYAQSYPFSYPIAEQPDLVRLRERHYPDPDHEVDRWAKRFVRERGLSDTRDILSAINQAIHEGFAYERRYAVGIQTPAETLTVKSGTCRDFSLLMMEAVRALGFAARFVTGYLYDPSLDGADGGMVGAGDTHAWATIYLPGAGWIEYDPTNGVVGGRNLIRVAAARDPSQAVPLSGTYLGASEDFVDMEVSVEVRAG